MERCGCPVWLEGLWAVSQVYNFLSANRSNRHTFHCEFDPSKRWDDWFRYIMLLFKSLKENMKNSATWLHPVLSAMVGWPHCSIWQAVLGLCLQFCLQILCQSPLAVPMRFLPLVTFVGRCVLWLRLSRWETVLSSVLNSLGCLYVWHIPNPISSCLVPTLQVTFPLLFCFLSPKLPTVHLCYRKIAGCGYLLWEGSPAESKLHQCMNG